MTFIKYTNDGKAVIQPAALVLSGLEDEDILEMHTLDNVLVLLKEEMPPVEKVKTMCSLMRLVSSLTADLMCGFDECIDDEADDDCEDTVLIPAWAFEEARKRGEIQVVDRSTMNTAGEGADAPCDKTAQAVSKHLSDAAVSLSMASDLLRSGDANA